MATLTAEQVYAAARGAGATHQEAVTLTAVARGESGWRNDAHNPNAGTGDNSYGLWQINMLGTMGANRRKQFGISSNEQLFDPRVNARAALAILRSQGWKAWTVYTKGIYRQYLPAAQAAGTKWQNNWQSVAQSLNQAWPAGAGTRITANSGGVGDTLGGGEDFNAYGGGGAGAPPGLPPNATPQQIEDYIRENYPQAAGFLDIPEIRAKLIEGAQSSWTSTKLQAEIQATDWWRTNSESTRQFFALQGTDPAQVTAMIDAKVAELQPEMAQLGVTGVDIRKLAEDAIKFGWTPDQMRQRLSLHLVDQSNRTGLAQDSAPDVTADKLMGTARSEFLVPLNRQDAERWAIEIYAGNRTEEQFRSYLSRMSAARFPGLTEQGITPGEYLAPVRNIIADTLELNPADVDFLDRRWSAVLEAEGKDGTFRPMSIAEAQRWARSQTEYRYTAGAQKEAASMAESLGRTFGAVA